MSVSAAVAAASTSRTLVLARRRSPPASRVAATSRGRPFSSGPHPLAVSPATRAPAMATDCAAAAAAAGSKKKKEVLIFDAEEDLAVSLAKYTAELSAKLAAERGAFTVVLSGGSLIKNIR